MVLTLYNNQIKRGITVVRDYKEIPLIRCYPDELGQVWTNLIDNALYAMNGSGELTISVYAKNGEIIVEFGDSGVGIQEQTMERIFEPFYTTKPSGEGSGMGLDIVKNIIERHHGRAEVESCPGKTVFRVFLPIGVRNV